MKLLTIDGNSVLNRAFYGIKLLTTKEGVYTNGIYGFLSILLKVLEETAPDRVAVTLTKKAARFAKNNLTDTKPGAKECRQSWRNSFRCSSNCWRIWVMQW